MTRKEQNKILDAKIESNVNQYKVDRLNAEISAFLSGDLNKYEFLKRIDLNYKRNALDKARFGFSPLGKTFSTGLDKNVQGYQEEGIIKLLKDIKDSLARPPRPKITEMIIDQIMMIMIIMIMMIMMIMIMMIMIMMIMIMMIMMIIDQIMMIMMIIDQIMMIMMKMIMMIMMIMIMIIDLIKKI